MGIFAILLIILGTILLSSSWTSTNPTGSDNLHTTTPELEELRKEFWNVLFLKISKNVSKYQSNQELFDWMMEIAGLDESKVSQLGPGYKRIWEVGLDVVTTKWIEQEFPDSKNRRDSDPDGWNENFQQKFYELKKEFDKEFQEMQRKFQEMERKFQDMERKLQEIEKKTREIEKKSREIDQRLSELELQGGDLQFNSSTPFLLREITRNIDEELEEDRNELE